MYRTILMTGTGSGFGESTAIGLAPRGHTVIAATQSWPRRCATRPEFLGLSGLRVEKPDLLEAHDTARVMDWEFDRLVNNAGTGSGGNHGKRTV